MHCSERAERRTRRQRGGSLFQVPETPIRTGPSENPGAPYWPGLSDELPGRITLAVSRDLKKRTTTLAPAMTLTSVLAEARACSSLPPRRIDAIELSQDSRPGDHAARLARDGLRRLADSIEDRLRDRDELRAARLRAHLHLARPLQDVHGEERFGDVLCAREQAVVAQHEVVVRAEVAHEARLLLGIQRHALVVVVREVREREERLLREGKQSRLLARHGDALDGVQVHHALRVVARLVHRAVDGEAGRIDVER